MTDLTSIFSPIRPLSELELRQQQERELQRYKEWIVNYALSFVPQIRDCYFCGERFQAMPNGDGEHDSYCSPYCEQMQGGIDACIDYELGTHERQYMARQEQV